METIIAVDAMGSDRAPRPEIEGALLAVRHYPGVRVLLVGPEDRLRQELDAHPTAHSAPVEVVNAKQVIGMDEKPVQAVRTKRDSSLHVGLQFDVHANDDCNTKFNTKFDLDLINADLNSEHVNIVVADSTSDQW